jgi:uncharacterized protein (DUF983 family)
MFLQIGKRAKIAQQRKLIMPIETSYASADLARRVDSRAVWPAVKRGLRGRCPACGEGRLLHHYLKVNDVCPKCGEELHHHRADDFPPYITMFITGHVVGAAMFTVEEYCPDLPVWAHFLTWPTLALVLSLWLLPIVKGGLIAYQWALRMHGFEAPTASHEEQIADSPVHAAVPVSA